MKFFDSSHYYFVLILRKLRNVFSKEQVRSCLGKADSQRPMYFGDPSRRSLPTVHFNGAAIESAAVKQTLTETKRHDNKPNYPKRCKEKYQKNMFRLSFKPNLANSGRLTKIDSTSEGSDFQLREMYFSGVQGVQCI